MVLKMIDANTFRMSDEEVRRIFYRGTIDIHYATCGYDDSVEHILFLRDEILKDYPEKKNSEMTVWVISEHESCRHVGFTTLWVGIPVEDYLKLRKNGEVTIK